jgi:uncharacterized protein with HEPN domain
LFVPPRNWRLRIEDILDSIDRIQRYALGMDFASFSSNEMVIDAVVRNFAIIGEAASHVPDEWQRRYPELPWADMRDMRNVLVHEYFGADLRTIWDTVQADLPPLIPQMKRILDENP